MIIKETININGVDYIRQYSTENRCLVRDGVQYSEAIDPIGSDREYTEGDVMPEEENVFADQIFCGGNTESETM
jgi:hypothetical protein